LINLIIFKTFYKLKFVGCDKNHDFILFLLHKMQNWKKKKKFFFEFAKIEGKASLHQTNFNLKFCHNICYMLNKDKIIHGGIPVMF